MCCPLRSILACVRNLCYRVEKGKWLKVSCLSCERKRISEWLKKNVGDFSKNVGVFSENVGDFSKNVGRFPRNVGVFFRRVGDDNSSASKLLSTSGIIHC